MMAAAAGRRYSARRHVTQEQINAYAEASGDHNPLHVDPAFAAGTPLGGTIAHGMLVLAWLSALMTDAFGRDWAVGGALRIRFRAPARPGDELDLTATIRSTQPAEGGARLTLDVLVANARGEAVIDGQASVVVRGNLSS